MEIILYNCHANVNCCVDLSGYGIWLHRSLQRTYLASESGTHTINVYVINPCSHVNSFVEPI